MRVAPTTMRKVRSRSDILLHCIVSRAGVGGKSTHFSALLPWIPSTDPLAIPFSNKIMETLFTPRSGYTCALSYEPVHQCEKLH